MRIGLVLNVLDEQYQISVYKGVFKRAKELGIEIVCFQLENIKFSNPSFANIFPSQSIFNLDGIILLTSVIKDGYVLKTKDDVMRLWKNIPLVSVGQKIKDVPSLLIETDDSMKQLVEHLIIKHEYRNFLYISGSENHHDADRREQIFKETLEAYKPWFSDINYSIRRGWFNEHDANQVMKEYVTENTDKKLDAIVCANDNMAIGVYKFFEMNHQKGGVKECAVTGFDDIPQSRYVIPSLTTVRQPLEEIGSEAVDSILKLIKKETVPDESFIESKLVIRNSCGCKTKTEADINTEHFLQELQANYVQSEQLLRLVSHIWQDLNYSENETSLKNYLNANMERLEITNFCVLAFKDYQNQDDINEFSDVTVRPLFVRKSGRCFYEFNCNKYMKFSEFYKKYYEYDNNPIQNLTFKYLNSGNMIVGCIFYEAPFDILPYLCSISVSISQTITHINSLKERQKRSEYLENEIESRTKELLDANEKRMKVEAEVLKISELERQRFSTDLHDDICQRLAGISMLCRSYSNIEDSEEKEHMLELAELVSETLQTTRQYAHNSYPVELESLGINDSISNLCNTFNKQNNCKCIYEWKGNNQIKLNNIQKLNIFRIIQEAVHNVVKHAHATECKVLVEEKNNLLSVIISDDGIGIEFNSLKKGLGLNSMEYRANQIGALFTITKNEDKGTIIKIELAV